MGYVLEQAERLYLAVMKMNAFLNKCISGMLDLWAGKVTLSVRLLIQQFKWNAWNVYGLTRCLMFRLWLIPISIHFESSPKRVFS